MKSWRPLRILLVTETYPPEINGVAMTTGRMVAGLRGKGHWVGVLRPRQNPQDRGGELEWTVAGMALPHYPDVKLGWPDWGRINQLMRSLDLDVVHVVTEGPLGWAAVLKARRLGLPVTSGYHTHFDQYSRHYGLAWLTPHVTRWLDALHRRCQATIVPAPELAHSLTARGIPNVQVVGRGVDTHLYHPQRRDPELRRAWGVQAEDGLVCLYVGRLAPEKNLAAVARAFTALAVDHPGARMVWVGSGPAQAGLQAAYPEHVFAGARTGEDLARHYASADLFLFASLTETWGNVIGEALASGLAVVTYRRAAAEALIRDGENGLTPPPGDEAAFLAAARRLAFDAPLRQRMGAQACQDLGHDSWDAVTARMEHVFGDVLSQGVVAATA